MKFNYLVFTFPSRIRCCLEFLFFGATGGAVETIGYYYMHMVKKSEKMKLSYKIDFRGVCGDKHHILLTSMSSFKSFCIDNYLNYK